MSLTVDAVGNLGSSQRVAGWLPANSTSVDQSQAAYIKLLHQCGSPISTHVLRQRGFELPTSLLQTWAKEASWNLESSVPRFFLLHVRPKHHLEFRLCSFTAADTYALSHRQSRATSLSGVDLTLPSLKQRFFATRPTRLVRSSSLRPLLSPSCHIAGYLSI